MIHQKLIGKIVSNKMAKTVVVAVESAKRDPLYEKVQTTTKRFKAHTEDKLELGATVVIEQTRPLSKEKFWRVIKTLTESGTGRGREK